MNRSGGDGGLNGGRLKSRRPTASVECRRAATDGEGSEGYGGSEPLVFEPVSDVVFPLSSAEDDMPLPDDIQAESFGFR